MEDNTFFDEHTGFELFLEGTMVPFNAITVREIEGAKPTASVSFPATSGITHTLPGTIVQFFAPDPLTKEKILIFEGEITAFSYQKTQAGRYINFSAQSLLKRWESTTARPSDAMVTPKYKEISGDYSYQYYNLTEDSAGNGQETNDRYSEIVSDVKEKIKNESFGRLESALEEIRLTESFSFSDEISRLFSNEKFVGGDIDLFLKFFLRKFELLNPYYGIQANSFNLSNSIVAMPNLEKLKARKTQAILGNFFKVAREMKQSPFEKEALTLIVAIQELLSTIAYTLITPSSFTGSYQFWAQSDSPNTIKPVRGYMVPNLENSPPAKFNVMFPHEVESFNFSRNFMQEPTRTIGSLRVPFFQSIQNNIGGLESFVAEPNIDINDEGIKQNSTGMTVEESYQGIRPMFNNFSTLFTESTIELTTKESKGLNQDSIDSFNAENKQPLRQLTVDKHYKQKYRSRSCSFRTKWNPSRMVGVPGAYIEDGDGPSIVGTISAVTTSFDGRGDVSSTVSMRAVKVIDDIRDLVKESPNTLPDLISEFTRDPFVDINRNLHDEALYGYENIGKALYTIFKWGTPSNDETLLNYAKEDKTFSEGVSNLENLYRSNLTVKEDASIIDVLRNENGEIVANQSEDLLEQAPPTNSARSSANYTKLMYLSIYNLKERYKKLEKNTKALDRFVKEFTYRRITTKADYFTSIGIGDYLNPSAIKNYKDGVKLFTGQANMQIIKDTLNTTTGTRISDAIDEREIDDLKSALRTEELELSFLNKYQPDKEEEITQKSERIEEIKARLDELDEPYKEGTYSDIDTGLSFENEAFKPYNLTRKKHIDFGYSLFIKENFKNLRTTE